MSHVPGTRRSATGDVRRHLGSDHAEGHEREECCSPGE